MKELTKQIRKEVKRVIEEVGGNKNVLNKHITAINEKFLVNINPYSKYACDVRTTVMNQFYYFQYGKGM